MLQRARRAANAISASTLRLAMAKTVAAHQTVRFALKRTEKSPVPDKLELVALSLMFQRLAGTRQQVVAQMQVVRLASIFLFALVPTVK
jgi:hypothetical protein